MRLKVFQARTAGEAMAEARRALGEEAVIVATRELAGGGVQVTAATESVEEDLAELLAPRRKAPVEDGLADSLAYHEVPEALRARLLEAIRRAGIEEPVASLAQALREALPFAPAPGDDDAPLLLAGLPGAGKTAVAAKLAAAAVLADRAVAVITTDVTRAGAVAQLEALLRPLGLPLRRAEGPAELRRAVAACAEGALVVIDTMGANAFKSSELAPLAAYAEAAGAEVLAVAAAGQSPADAAEIAANLRALGARRMVVSRLDACRRLGGMLAAAAAGPALAAVGFSPLIGKGLCPLQPVALARLLLRHREPVLDARESAS
jgi:flagellar biosynthesis protein FlhF